MSDCVEWCLYVLQHRHKSGTRYVVLALCVCSRLVYTLPNGTRHQTTLGQSAVVRG